jgi:threonine synthase
MGLPIGKLAVATNANDILARFWKTGKYEKVDSTAVTAQVEGSSVGKQAIDASGVKETLSPAMDILVSSNFERLLWYLAFENAAGSSEEEKKKEACATLDRWMGQMKSNGRVEVPVSVLETARKDFVAERISDQQVGFIHLFHKFLIHNMFYRHLKPSNYILKIKIPMFLTRTLPLA